MPANPTQPNTNSSIDRLALGIDSPRGSETSNELSRCTICACFDVEAAGLPVPPFCFEAEASGIPCGCFACSCFETE